MKTLSIVSLSMVVVLSLQTGHAEASHQTNVTVLAVTLKQRAAHVYAEVQAGFGDTGAGRLIARKASEVDELANDFLRRRTCCDHRRTRMYLHELKDLVDEMEDLTNDLKRHGPAQSTRYLRFGNRGFSIVIGDTQERGCGGCGHCDHCRRIHRLYESIECLEEAVDDLEKATRRCACCGMLRDASPHSRRELSVPDPVPHPTPGPTFPPAPHVVEPPTPQPSAHVPPQWQRAAQFWLSLALD